jgi:excisionase family DNA binding protein
MNDLIHRLPDLAGRLEEGSGSRFLTLRETAAFLNLHPNTVRSQVRRGKLPGAKVGRGWRFLEADLVAAIRARYPESRRNRHAFGLSEGSWHSGVAAGFMLPEVRRSAERALDALLERPAGAARIGDANVEPARLRSGPAAKRPRTGRDSTLSGGIREGIQ